MSPESKLQAALDQSEVDTMKPVNDIAMLLDCGPRVSKLAQAPTSSGGNRITSESRSAMCITGELTSIAHPAIAPAVASARFESFLIDSLVDEASGSPESMAITATDIKAPEPRIRSTGSSATWHRCSPPHEHPTHPEIQYMRTPNQ